MYGCFCCVWVYIYDRTLWFFYFTLVKLTRYKCLLMLINKTVKSYTNEGINHVSQTRNCTKCMCTSVYRISSHISTFSLCIKTRFVHLLLTCSSVMHITTHKHPEWESSSVKFQLIPISTIACTSFYKRLTSIVSKLRREMRTLGAKLTILAVLFDSHLLLSHFYIAYGAPIGALGLCISPSHLLESDFIIIVPIMRMGWQGLKRFNGGSP